jgi:MFS family permease
MLLDLTPLKISRDYRLLFFGQLVSFFGSMMTFIVVPWQMYQLTKSSAMVGLFISPNSCRWFVSPLSAARFADALDRRRMLRLTEIGQCFVTTILLINSLLPNPQIWVLFVAVALHAGFAAFSVRHLNL